MRSRRGLPPRARLRTSFWTSAGACAVLLAAHECQRLPGWRGSRGRGGLSLRGVAAADLEGGEAVGAHARRLSEEEQLYPEDGILDRPYNDDPQRWLVIFHVLGIGYMLLGLNTVCDIYFTGSLEEMVTEWQVKPDVAGATFMAAGGSAPEFFTALIGTTIAMSDVGSSTIVGSAVFNVLFVIGLCGFVAEEAIDLSWWPLFRDCTFYIFGLVILAIVVSDRLIAVWEAAILFGLYLMYLSIMWFNPQLEALAYSFGSAKVVPDVGVNNVDTTPIEGIGGKTVDEVVNRKSKGSEEDSEAQTSSTRASPDPDAAVAAAKKVADDGTCQKVADDGTCAAGAKTGADDGVEAAENGDDDDDDDGDLMDKPEGGVALAIWYFSLPIYIPLWYLTPQPTSENWTFPVPKFVFCFMVSLCWIAGFAFLLVWWVEILGQVIGVPDVIMGFTVLAAGTSIPDAVSSMAVARNGEGDMAVSSSIGSNIFDILIGLPVPWMIKTGIIEGSGFKVRVNTPYLVFYIILLLSMVFSSVTAIHFNGWKLNKTLGIAMAVLYCVFLSIALTVEYSEVEFLQIG